MRQLQIPLVALLFALLVPAASAQTTPPGAPAATGQDLDLRYVGASTRLGIGYDSQNKLRGDAFAVFGETDRSAWIGELWFADRGAGGGQISYHWQPASAEPVAGVRKLFAAIDQNRWHDRKLTLGGGLETEPWFVSGYASGALTGRRELGVGEVTTMQTITGSDTVGPFEQDVFTTVRTTLFERAYDYGVGVRAGHFFDAQLVRVQVGFDYEIGKSAASQSTISLGIEKYFAGTPHSIALVAEAYHKNGELEPTRNDQRVTAMYRYEFGGNSYRPSRAYRDVKVEIPAPAGTPAAVASPRRRPRKPASKSGWSRRPHRWHPMPFSISTRRCCGPMRKPRWSRRSRVSEPRVTKATSELPGIPATSEPPRTTRNCPNAVRPPSASS